MEESMTAAGKGALTLKLEAVNDDVVHAYRSWRRHGGEIPWRLRYVLEDIGCYDRLAEVYRCPPSPWVAALTLAPNGSVQRDFLDGHRDYGESQGMGSRGVYMYFHLKPGFVYEIGEVKVAGLSKRGNIRTEQERYFAVVGNGQLRRISRDEAFALLTG